MGVNDNNNAWLNQPIPSSSSAGDPFGGYGALIYALGNMGQGMLKGTNQEWLAAPGATAANMASNQLSGNKYQSLLDALNKAAAATSANPQTPALGKASVSADYDPTGQYITKHKFDLGYQHGEGVSPVPTTAKAEPTIATGLGQALSNPGQLNFPQALLRTRW